MSTLYPEPMPITLSDSHRRQMAELGISAEDVERQLELFRDPPPPIRLDRPATVGDGIEQLGARRRAAVSSRFEEARGRGEVAKWVPASGAASRMFRTPSAALAGEELTAEQQERMGSFFAELPRFAFYDELRRAMAAAGCDLEDCLARGERRPILDLLLNDRGLGYADLPKALIPFHRYGDGTVRTPFEEHLAEAAAYLQDRDGVCRLHLTVARRYEGRFRQLLARVAPAYRRCFGSRFEVTFSHQEHATDTLAVDLDDQPFRLDDGSLLFRPGGHGALLGNLERCVREHHYGIVLIQNIDNVLPEGEKEPTIRWKKLLGGLLLALRDRIFDLSARLEEAGEEEAVTEAAAFVEKELGLALPEGSSEERRRWLIEHLDRPLRVCGMVANKGEPGGGPFWVRAPSGELSLQIVEGSQIDPEQRPLLAAATHFNPVDLACSLTDRHGRVYPLDEFVDPQAVFIARKSHEGRPLKALEWPGLWNGGMAGWNTVFVEVPAATFAPVKTVFDLLRPEHQPG